MTTNREAVTRWRNDVSRGRSLARALKVLIRITSRPFTLRELATEYGVSPRTIRRDLYCLEEAGVPLVHESHAEEWSVVSGWRLQ